MQTVWKFQLRMENTQDVSMPDGAIPLRVIEQGNTIALWALVKPDRPKVTRQVTIVGTGAPVDDKLGVFEYVDSVLLHGGSLVFHVFLK